MDKVATDGLELAHVTVLTDAVVGKMFGVKTWILFVLKLSVKVLASRDTDVTRVLTKTVTFAKIELLSTEVARI